MRRCRAGSPLGYQSAKNPGSVQLAVPTKILPLIKDPRSPHSIARSARANPGAESVKAPTWPDVVLATPLLPARHTPTPLPPERAAIVTHRGSYLLAPQNPTGI